MRYVAFLAAVLLFGASAASAIDVGSDGSDGALNITATTTVDLSLAQNGAWNTPGNGHGVYDANRWVVVFKFTSVNIAANRTIGFTNHPSGAPVVWLVQGDVTIGSNAYVILYPSGNADSAGFLLPGPGGFRGGRVGAAGMGPGGGGYNYGGGGYATVGGGSLPGAAYGNIRILPLIGGSGGGGVPSNSGGGGGGAILIAANGTITLTGGVAASGGAGAGGGSGGGIRLIANTIAGFANNLTAGAGGSNASVGRIRLEANFISLTGASYPPYSFMIGLDPNNLAIFPTSSDPTLRVTTFGGQPVPTEPRAQFVPPADLTTISTDSVAVELAGANIPVFPGRRWNVVVRMLRRVGAAVSVNARYASGDSVSSVWTAKVPPLPQIDFAGIEAKAYKP